MFKCASRIALSQYRQSGAFISAVLAPRPPSPSSQPHQLVCLTSDMPSAPSRLSQAHDGPQVHGPVRWAGQGPAPALGRRALRPPGRRAALPAGLRAGRLAAGLVGPPPRLPHTHPSPHRRLSPSLPLLSTPHLPTPAMPNANSPRDRGRPPHLPNVPRSPRGPPFSMGGRRPPSRQGPGGGSPRGEEEDDREQGEVGYASHEDTRERGSWVRPPPRPPAIVSSSSIPVSYPSGPAAARVLSAGRNPARLAPRAPPPPRS